MENYKARDYIVCIKEMLNCGVFVDYIYKLSRSNEIFADNHATSINGLTNYNSHFRKATIQEINKFDELGKPFNVDDLLSKNEDLNYLIGLLNKIGIK